MDGFQCKDWLKGKPIITQILAQKHGANESMEHY